MPDDRHPQGARFRGAAGMQSEPLRKTLWLVEICYKGKYYQRRSDLNNWWADLGDRRKASW